MQEDLCKNLDFHHYCFAISFETLNTLLHLIKISVFLLDLFYPTWICLNSCLGLRFILFSIKKSALIWKRICGKFMNVIVIGFFATYYLRLLIVCSIFMMIPMLLTVEVGHGLWFTNIYFYIKVEECQLCSDCSFSCT